MEKISFVIPCYRSAKTIGDVVSELQEIMRDQSEYDYEIILTNDGSPDNVWDVIKELCSKDEKVKGVNFSKNFGQAAAVMAGYGQATGDYICTIDDDGQSPVDAVMELMKEMKEGDHDVVYGITTEVQFGLYRKLGSKVNSLMAKMMFDRPTDKRIVNISLIKKYVIDEVVKYQYPYPYISGLVHRTTRRIGYVPVKHRARQSGKSGYSFKKLLAVWMNGFTSFSIKPLRLASYLGFFTAGIGLLGSIVIVILKLLRPATAVGWSSLICTILVMGGINLIVLGLIGEYLGRMYMSINQTPQYVIRECLNDNDSESREV
ncbi:MAG: glycosyltransferase family 2 protein [Lachnospiraceae bacterium]|nr:glycosyltransferase family 2 protein [Lachnospiraceae bacterium]